MWLTVARDVYGEHYRDLPETKFKRLRELAALQILENEEFNRDSKSG